MKIARNNLGMTVVEMMLSMFVIALLSLGLFSMLMHGLRGWSKGAGTEAAGGAAAIALQRFSNDIRDARSATVSGSELIVTFPRTNTDPFTNEEAYDAAANDPITRSYYVSDNGNLVRKVGTDIKVLARNVSDETTIYASGNGVQVTIVSKQQLGPTECRQEATGHITLRNYH